MHSANSGTTSIAPPGRPCIQRGRIVQCGRIFFKCAGAFLQLKLPCGRKLSYPFPRIEIEDLRHQAVVFADNAAGQFKDCATAMARTAACGRKTSSQRSPAICSPKRCSVSRPLAIRSCCTSMTKLLPRCRSASAAPTNSPTYDAQTVLGARSADRSQCLERPRYRK